MKPRFVAIRHDGLGHRLQAVHTAFSLARHFEADFEFSWPRSPAVETSEHHVFDSAENIFSPQFRSKHHREGWSYFLHGYQKGTPRHKSYHDHVVRPEQIERIRAGLPIHRPCLIADAHDLEKLLGPDFKVQDYETAFKAIGFSDGVKAAIDAAEAVPLSEASTAIHLRAGDIIYGNSRGHDRFSNLVIAPPLACSIALQEQEDGREVIAFGQDIRSLSEIQKAGARSADEILRSHEFDDVQSLFFEMRLMSRCARIIAGNSSFARFAARSGGKHPTWGHGLLDGPRAKKILDEYDWAHTSLDSLQIGFSYWSVVSRYHDAFDLRDRLHIVRRAAEHDEDNVLFAFARIMYETEAGETEAALQLLETLIAEHAGRQGPNTLAHLLWTMADGFVPKAFEPARKAFFELAWSGQPAAALCQAFIAGNKDRAREFGEAFLASAHPSKSAYGNLVQRHLDRL